MKEWKEVHEEILKDPEAIDEFLDLRPQCEVVYQIIKARSEMGLTQADLAARTGLKLRTISRIEICKYSPSLSMLLKIGKVLGMELHIEFRALREPGSGI